MEIHGGNGALRSDMEGTGKLHGKYVGRPKLVVAVPDGISYDESTQTFTLSEEIIERLRNGE